MLDIIISVPTGQFSAARRSLLVDVEHSTSSRASRLSLENFRACYQKNNMEYVR